VPRNYAEVMACDKERFNRFFHAMLDAGHYFAPSAFEAGFVSAAHSEADIDSTIAAAEAWFAARRSGRTSFSARRRFRRCSFGGGAETGFNLKLGFRRWRFALKRRPLVGLARGRTGPQPPGDAGPTSGRSSPARGR
jgi:hypothetical protein